MQDKAIHINSWLCQDPAMGALGLSAPGFVSLFPVNNSTRVLAGSQQDALPV